MPLTPQQFTTLRRAFADVCRGYSAAPHRGGLLFVRHLSHIEQCRFEETQEQFRLDAISRGALPETERLAYLIKKGLWTEERETEIARQRETVMRFEEGKRNLVVPSMIRRHEEQTRDERTKLGKLLAARAEAIGMTAELFAQQRLNDHYILHNVFSDRELITPLFTESDFEDLPESEVQGVVDTYNSATEPCSDSNLRLLSVQDFFMSYFSLAGDSLADFFGRPVSQMTYYQTRLGSVARYFRSIMSGTDLSRLPTDLRNDPESLERAHSSQHNQAQMAAEGRVPNVGLTKEDVAQMGLEGQIAKLPAKPSNLNDMIEHLRKTSQPVSTH